MRHTFAAGIAVACLALLGCAGSYEEQADATRAALIGKTRRELRKCLGVPTDVETDGVTEYLTYRWVYDENKRDKIGSGGYGGIVLGRSGAAGGGDPMGFPPDPDQQSYCQLVFSLDKSGVTEVTASGRDHTGLRPETSCLMRARHCVDDDYADTE